MRGLGGWHWLGWFEGMVAHVFLERAFITESIVPSRLLHEEAVKTLRGTVTWDGWVVVATVGGVVCLLGVSTLTTYPTLFIQDRGVGACIYVVG